jgi:hypothetical protein
MQCSNGVSLLDHLVGGREQGWRHGEAQHLGGLQIKLMTSSNLSKLPLLRKVFSNVRFNR